MVLIVKIKGLNKVQDMISGYSESVPLASKRGIYNLARFGAKTYKLEALRAGLKPWGGGNRELFRDTRAVKINNTTWGVKMPIHGVYQDKMKPHWVALRKGRLITKWAKSKGFKGSGIFVKPHPFLNAANAKIFARAKEIIEKEVNSAIKRKGK